MIWLKKLKTILNIFFKVKSKMRKLFYLKSISVKISWFFPDFPFLFFFPWFFTDILGKNKIPWYFPDLAEPCELHTAHPGMQQMKALARRYVWSPKNTAGWVAINQAIKPPSRDTNQDSFPIEPADPLSERPRRTRRKPALLEEYDCS